MRVERRCFWDLPFSSNWCTGVYRSKYVSAAMTGLRMNSAWTWYRFYASSISAGSGFCASSIRAGSQWPTRWSRFTILNSTSHIMTTGLPERLHYCRGFRPQISWAAATHFHPSLGNIIACRVGSQRRRLFESSTCCSSSSALFAVRFAQKRVKVVGTSHHWLAAGMVRGVSFLRWELQQRVLRRRWVRVIRTSWFAKELHAVRVLIYWCFNQAAAATKDGRKCGAHLDLTIDYTCSSIYWRDLEVGQDKQPGLSNVKLVGLACWVVLCMQIPSSFVMAMKTTSWEWFCLQALIDSGPGNSPGQKNM